MVEKIGRTIRVEPVKLLRFTEREAQFSNLVRADGRSESLADASHRAQIVQIEKLENQLIQIQRKLLHGYEERTGSVQGRFASDREAALLINRVDKKGHRVASKCLDARSVCACVEPALWTLHCGASRNGDHRPLAFHWLRSAKIPIHFVLASV